MDKIIALKKRLSCSPDKAFEMFTKNTLLEQWLTQKADVEPEEGGKYELYWQPDTPEINSTFGCKILAIKDPTL